MSTLNSQVKSDGRSSPVRRAERRKHRRAPLSTQVQLINVGRTHITRGRDVSEGGLSVVSAQPLALNTPVKAYVSVPLAFSTKLRLHVIAGRVAWIRGNEAGIQFDDLAQETRWDIAQYVRNTAPSGAHLPIAAVRSAQHRPRK